MTALARRLKSRGNEVVFIGVPDVQPFARAAGLTFVPYCENEYPAGSIMKLYSPISKLHGLEVARWSIREMSCDLFSAATKHLPQKLAETGVEALVIDKVHSFLELVPMSLDMPYVQVWNLLHFDLSGATPPCHFSWPYESTPEARARNIEGVKALCEIFARFAPLPMAYAEKVGLKIDWSDRDATLSKLAVITQTPKEFDFPGISWPAQFHYTGPFHDDEGREPVPFPWEKLTGKPLIYASLGTLVNGLDNLYKHILQAVQPLQDVQVVLSVGHNFDPENLGPVPSNTLVVRSAAQIQLLKRAAFCITHAGLDTTLESLANGVRMVAIPIGFDQPGVAARIAHHGTGEFIEIDELTTGRLRGLIEKVLHDPSYRERAEYFREGISKTRGLDMAADIVEQAFQNIRRKSPRDLKSPLGLTRVPHALKSTSS
ncbi:MAG TPA: nucleotide disphospho-sugar-binding domain-containing protein [Chthoniobacterales bacterium]|nr:nucleotide disphospho-sugar-binding domain-containing protein [Chthoniobacterales bacterium]